MSPRARRAHKGPEMAPPTPPVSPAAPVAPTSPVAPTAALAPTPARARDSAPPPANGPARPRRAYGTTMSPRRQWAILALALVLAVTTALGLGWFRHQRVDPDPRRWLEAGDSLEHSGSVFSEARYAHVEMPTDSLTEIPAGAQLVVVRVGQHVEDVPPDNYELMCDLELVSQGRTYQADSSLAYELEIPTDCHNRPDGESIQSGDEQVVAGLFVLPGPLEEDPEVLLRFPVTRDVVGLRPELAD